MINRGVIKRGVIVFLLFLFTLSVVQAGSYLLNQNGACYLDNSDFNDNATKVYTDGGIYLPFNYVTSALGSAQIAIYANNTNLTNICIVLAGIVADTDNYNTIQIIITPEVVYALQEQTPGTCLNNYNTLMSYAKKSGDIRVNSGTIPCMTEDIEYDYDGSTGGLKVSFPDTGSINISLFGSANKSALKTYGAAYLYNNPTADFTTGDLATLIDRVQWGTNYTLCGVNNNSELVQSLQANYTAKFQKKAIQVINGDYLNQTLFSGLLGWLADYFLPDIRMPIIKAGNLSEVGAGIQYCSETTCSASTCKPVLQEMGTQTVAEGNSYNKNLLTTLSDYTGYSGEYWFTDNTTLFNINPSTGIISFTPTVNGTHSVRVKVGHYGYPGFYDVQKFTFVVSHVNDAPVLDPVGSLTIVAGSTLTYDVNATDEDNPTLTYTNYSVGASGFMSMAASTGVMTFTPNGAQNGVYTINVTASDGIESDWENFTLTVLVNTSSNTAPNITSYAPTVSSVSIKEDSLQLFEVNKSDSESAPTVQWYLDGSALAGQTSDSYTFRGNFTDSGSNAGTYTIMVRVTDGQYSDTQSWTLQVNRTPDTDGDGTANYQDGCPYNASTINAADCAGDKDSDGVADNVDLIQGDAQDIDSDTIAIAVEVDNSTDLNQQQNGIVTIELVDQEENETIIQFDFDLGQENLTLGDISINKETLDGKNSLIISGLDLAAQGETKTIYMDKASSLNAVCVRDAPTVSVSDFTDDCDGDHEAEVICAVSPTPVTIEDHNVYCYLESERYRITGLYHSGVEEFDCTPSWAYTQGSCTNHNATRTYSDSTNCNSSTYQLVVGCNPSSGGSSSTVIIHTTQLFSIKETQTVENIGIGDQFKFTLSVGNKTEYHTMEVSSISPSNVTLEITSNPAIAAIGEGKVLDIDVNKDGVSDIRIKVDNIILGKATITFTRLVVVKPTNTEAGTTEPEESPTIILSTETEPDTEQILDSPNEEKEKPGENLSEVSWWMMIPFVFFIVMIIVIYHLRNYSHDKPYALNHHNLAKKHYEKAHYHNEKAEEHKKKGEHDKAKEHEALAEEHKKKALEHHKSKYLYYAKHYRKKAEEHLNKADQYRKEGKFEEAGKHRKEAEKHYLLAEQHRKKAEELNNTRL